MKFKIYATRCEYRDIWIQDLKDIGFTFRDLGNKWNSLAYEESKDLTIFHINQPIDIELNSIQDVIDLQKKCGQIIFQDDNNIEIYNDHHS